MLSMRPLGSICGSLEEEETSTVSSREEGSKNPSHERQTDPLLNVGNRVDIIP